jgi:hypothetical protein
VRRYDEELSLASTRSMRRWPHVIVAATRGILCALDQFLRPIPQVTTVEGTGHWAQAEFVNAVPPGRRQLLSTNEYPYGQIVDRH